MPMGFCTTWWAVLDLFRFSFVYSLHLTAFFFEFWRVSLSLFPSTCFSIRPLHLNSSSPVTIAAQTLSTRRNDHSRPPFFNKTSHRYPAEHSPGLPDGAMQVQPPTETFCLFNLRSAAFSFQANIRHKWHRFAPLKKILNSCSAFT